MHLFLFPHCCSTRVLRSDMNGTSAKMTEYDWSDLWTELAYVCVYIYIEREELSGTEEETEGWRKV